MSSGISIDMSQMQLTRLQTNSVINNNRISRFNVSGLDKENTSSSVAMSISQEGKSKLENSSANTKKAGVTSTREAWEDNSAKLKKEARYSSTSGEYDIQEMMRLDDPDTYARVRELQNKAFELLFKKNNDIHIVEHSANYEIPNYKKVDFSEIEISADKAIEVQLQKAEVIHSSERPTVDNNPTVKTDKTINELFAEASRLEWDWFQRRCMNTGRLRNPVFKQYSDLDALENKYSTEGHDTRFNYYTNANSNLREDSLWRYCAKFNVLLDAHMVKNLDDSLFKKIDKAVTEMKNAEKEYEGNLSNLQFGVKLWDDGRVTYHARYEGCENEAGIMADSAEELLEMLMKK